MFCHKCGNELPEDSAFCPKCGTKLIEDKEILINPVAITNPISPVSKKTHKKLIFGVAGIAVVIIVIIAIVLNLGGGTEYPNELLYEGVPVSRFLEMTRDDFITEFGEPDQSYPDYPGIHYDDKGISLINFSEETGKVIHMNFYAGTGKCTFNGRKFVNTTTEKAMKNISTPEGTQITPSNIIDYSFYSRINQVTDPKHKFFRVIEDDYTLEFITYEDFVVDIFLCSNELDRFIGDESASMGSEADSADAYPGELLYKGQAIANLLGSTPEELNKIFGNPTGGTPVTGEFLYGGTEYYIYDGIRFMLGDQGTAVNITVAADVAEINGATLDQNRTGIINLLGTPGYEEKLPEDESGEGLGGYYIMEYTFYEDLTIIIVEMPDADSNANTVRIVRYDDGLGDEEYQQSSTDADDSNATQNAGVISFTDLLGKWQWRGQDVVDAALGIGGTKQLTLYSNGTCEGQIATSGSVNGEFIMAFAPDEWSYLEYEQILQVSALTTGWDWNSNGTPVQVPVYKTLNFRVSMSGNSLRLENVDNPDSKNIEYIKAN